MAAAAEKKPEEELTDISFEDAFKDFSVSGDSPEEPPVKEVTDEDKSETLEEETSGDEDDVDTSESEDLDTGETEEQVEDDEVTEEESETSEVEEDEDDQAKPSRLSDDELIEKLSKAIKPKEDEDPKKEESQEQEETPPVYSEDEQKLLDDYRKEWPDVAKAESLARREEYSHLVQYMFTQIADQLRPMMEQLNTLSERSHYSELKSEVSDYDTLRDDVIEWVDTQPDYLQNAYKTVISEGTVEQVSDLVDRYKAETGWKDPNAQKETERELPDTAKKAAKSLAPVSSKRTAVPKADDPEDFDQAFAKFADKL